MGYTEHEPEAANQGSTRREVLRRAGIVGGVATAAWATPVITTLTSPAFASGSAASAMAFAQGPCGAASSDQVNSALRQGRYAAFTVSFPGAPQGTTVRRMIYLNGNFQEGPVDMQTDASGTAGAFPDVNANVPSSIMTAEVRFTLLDGSGRSVSLDYEFVAVCP